MSSETIENNDPGTEATGGKLQLVRAGSSQFGIFADEISAIVVWQEPAPLPHAPSSVLGVVSIQGRMLTVLDLAAIVVGEDAMRNAAGNLIALCGDEQLALAVDAVGETITFTENDSLTKSDAELTSLSGILNHQGAEIKVLNLPGLFPSVFQGRQRRQRQF